MAHGEKTLLFLAELEGIFRKYNVMMGYSTAKAKFLIHDLDGEMRENWKDDIVDLSAHRVEEKPSFENAKFVELVDPEIIPGAKLVQKEAANGSKVKDVFPADEKEVDVSLEEDLGDKDLDENELVD